MSGFILPTDPSKTKGFVWTEKHTVKIKNFQNDSLIAYPEQFTVTFQPYVEANKADFDMNIYKDLNGCENRIPVVFSCKLGNKTYLLCAASNLLILKECAVPEKIQSGESELMFYKRDFQDKYQTFESSVKKGFFLAFNEKDWNLILKPYPEDNPDIKAAFLLEITKHIFIISDDEPIPCNIFNNLDDLLIPHPEKCIASFASDGPIEEKKAIFYLQKYSNSSPSDTGLPVIFSCKVDDKNYLLSAESNSIILKEGELPKEILTKTSKFIFHGKDFFGEQSSYRFESSLNKKNCLAWSTEDPNKQLILKTFQEEVIDETMKIYLSLKSEDASALRSTVRFWKQTINK